MAEIAGSNPADRTRQSTTKMDEMPKKKTPSKKRGRPPETLKIEGDWKDALKQALKRGKPPSKKKK